MKKLIFVLALLLTFTTCTAFGADVSVVLNGEKIATEDVNGNSVPPFISDGTIYVPVRAIAAALGVEIAWDGDSRSVIIGDRGDAAPELSENVGIYINGKKFTPKDANGKEVSPIIQDGTTYLPVRAIAQTFAKKVDWDEETNSVIIRDGAVFDAEKTYKITAAGTRSAIVPSGDSSGSALKVEKFDGSASGLWKFVPDENGFYQIVNAKSGCAMDVNGASLSAGAKILQYNAGTGDNQKFIVVDNGDTCKIYSKNSQLPIENSAGDVLQAAERESGVQNWIIEEAEASETEEEIAYKYIRVKGENAALTYAEDDTSLTIESAKTEAQMWQLVPTSEGYYAINTKNGGKSIDVANNSTQSGDPLITYASSSDDNQRWIFEKQADGGYKIKSVSSELYITNLNGTVVQTETGTVFELSDTKGE